MKKFALLMMSVALLWAPLSHASTYAKTQYPIVLVHGLFGFDDVLWVDYFYKIPYKLQRKGAKVYAATVSPANSTEVRGEQLLSYVNQVLAHSGAEKVNLIGHSHGGPTARYVASVAPSKVASVTTVAGVNGGSPVADIVLTGLSGSDVLQGTTATVFNGFVNILELLSGSNPSQLPTDSLAALRSLSTEGANQFNQRYPEGLPSRYCANDGRQRESNGVQYFSWSGGKTYTNVFDVADPLLALTGLAFSETNDGLVSSCSSHLGNVLKDNYRMNHLDEVNQTLGITHLFETDPAQVYVRHANRLKGLGL
ncbi:lipase family alpha/beta hydrolase [Alteromonas oceanisediminis]|uniref:lipase family alpha/beta hydrolase n=1 Tax=Alteromonas oceanisediminis TaxID=2836180 RepID=UPI001BD9B09E|nr:triacylglycerol lipase [Alteromonas oceanisediminis]MBT0585456.1 triacylglycerol lipase [Alteromonas oceanisediminis]